MNFFLFNEKNGILEIGGFLMVVENRKAEIIYQLGQNKHIFFEPEKRFVFVQDRFDETKRLSPQLYFELPELMEIFPQFLELEGTIFHVYQTQIVDNFDFSLENKRWICERLKTVTEGPYCEFTHFEREELAILESPFTSSDPLSQLFVKTVRTKQKLKSLGGNE